MAPRPRAAAIALLLLLTAAALWPVTRAEFINLDDPAYVSANDHVRRGLGPEGLRWAFGTLQGGNWHPLTWISHMLDVTLFGTGAGAHHAVSLLIHAANAALLFLLLANLTGAPRPSALVAALFAVHPQHVESVAWVAERKDVLSTFFGLLALGAYLRQVRAPGAARSALTAALFALSLLSKPMLVTLPLLLLLIDYWPLGRFAPPGHRPAPAAATLLPLLREKIPLLSLAAAAGAVALIAQERAEAVTPLGELGFGARLANALLSCGAYLGKTAWPLGLSVFYPHAGDGAHRLAPLAASAAVLVTATAAAVHLRRRLPFLVTGWLWYLGTLLPVIGLLQVGAQARADRYTYLPLAGIFIIVAWGASSLLPGKPVPLAVAAVTALLLLGAAAHLQANHWRDDVSLFGHALAVNPDDPLAMKNYGYGLSARGRPEEGDALVRQAHELDPSLKEELFVKTALLREREGRIEEAAAYLREALRLNPAARSAGEGLERLLREHPVRARDGGTGGRIPAHGPGSLGGSEHFRRGNELAAAKRLPEAIAAYREAIRLQPSLVEAWNNLGSVYGDLGRPQEAEAAYREALRLRPDYDEARDNLARALAAQGRRR